MRYTEANMAALLKKDASIDPSKRAANILDYVIEDTSEENIREKELQAPVRDELQKAPLISKDSSRQKSRVLFITRDISVLQPDSLMQLQFRNLSSVFDEIHILVLSEAWQTKKGVDRLATNMWVYTTSVRYWWMQPFVAVEIAKSQLQFTDGFRPDVVVALDPFESGVSGLFIAEKYEREFQVHVLEDFFVPEFKEKDQINKWRLRMASYVLKRAQSVRTATTTINERIVKKFKHITDLALLPRHYNIEAIIAASELPVSADPFPQYSFVALFVGKLDHESTLFRAIDAARSVLTSPRICLVVVGDGPAQKEFAKRAEILGINEQVIFEKDQSKLLTCLKSADILLCTDTTEASDEVVIKAAAAGLPLLVAETELRKDLFTDGESAFLVPKEDTVGFSQKLVKFLNTNSLRSQFKENAKEIIKTRLHEDPQAYKLAYRDSIEQVFSSTESTKKP